jgi:hypothetical protein
MLPLLQSRPAGGGGVSDHGLLSGLLDDDHSQYALLAGRSGGQTLIGGLAASEHLTLRSTAHPTAGYVRAYHDLQLNTNILRDSAATNRLQLAAASPHVYLRNEVCIGTRLGLGAAPDPNTGILCNPAISANNANIAVIGMNPSLGLTGGTGLIFGLQGQALANVYSGATASLMAGLYFTALAANVGTVQALYAIWARAGVMSYSGPAPSIWGLLIVNPWLYFSTVPTACVGVEIQNQGRDAGSSTYNAIGLKIADQTGTTGDKYILELGPATPYLRLVGGAAPAANQTNLFLNEGGNLRQVQWKLYSALVPADRVMVLV